MGAYQSNIQQNNTRTVQAYNRILRAGEDLLRNGALIGWNPNNSTLCDRIVLLQKNTLPWVNTEELRDAAFALGFRVNITSLSQPTTTSGNQIGLTQLEYDRERQRLCTLITQYFVLKQQAIEYIQANLQNMCQDWERVIDSNWNRVLEGSPRATVEEAWRRRVIYSDVLYRWYERLASYLERLVRPIPMSELGQLLTDINRTLTQGYQDCCIAVYNLRDFTWVQYINPETGQPVIGLDPQTNQEDEWYQNTNFTGDQQYALGLRRIPRVLQNRGLSSISSTGGGTCNVPPINIQRAYAEQQAAALIQEGGYSELP